MSASNAAPGTSRRGSALLSVGGQIRLAFAIGLLGAAVVTGILWWYLQRMVAESMWSQLVNVAALAAKTWERDPDHYLLPRSSQLTLRLTVIAPDGRVLADSYREPEGIENQEDAPEVRQALEGRMARVARRSPILGSELLFVALPLIRDGRIVGVIRSSVSTSVMEERLTTLRAWLVVGFLICGAALFVLAEGLTRSLSRPLEQLSRAVRVPDGDLPRFDSGPREVVELSAALVAMRSQIRSQLESLAAQQKRQEDILKRLDDGIVVVDATGVAFANPAALRMLSAGLETLKERGRQPSDDLASRVLALAGTALDSPAQLQVSERGPFLLVDSADMRWGAGQERACMLVLRDVTEAVHLDRMRQEFVAKASHELKTPITAVSAAVEALELGAIDEPENRGIFLGRVRRAVDRLSRMARELLDLSVAEAAAPTDPDASCDAVEQIQQAVQGLAGAIEARRHWLEVAVPIGPVRVRMSDLDLQRVVSNVLENAIKYTPEAGQIRITMTVDAEQATIRVVDNGPGIGVADVSLIFERFFRANPARTESGAGLGLTIARHLVEKANGTISAANRPGGGAVLTVQVPVVAAVAATAIPAAGT